MHQSDIRCDAAERADVYAPGVPDQDQSPDVDIVIVGAGFAGMYMLHRARRCGYSARVFEAGSGVGGTWYWNRYPGARCDIESMEYSYGFDPDLQQDWVWSERYATQPEILRYAEHVADRFDLRRDITFDTRVLGARFDAGSDTWAVTTDDGEHVAARFVVFATGCLSSTNTPEFEGLSVFGGRVLHTGDWPHEPVDFTGRRVAVIGTGSSGIQSIPVIAEQAEHLTVFQRTPNYSVPAHNRPLDPDEVESVKADYAAFRAANRTMISGYGSRLPRNDVATLSVDDDTRVAQLEDRWRHGGLPFIGAFNDILLDPGANTVVADFVRGKIREVVRDAETAARLSPSTVIGCKRLCVDTGYYATFNRDDVELVDINRSPIERFTATGLIAGGVAFDFDVVVLATGFDAMTGTLLKIDIEGRDGQTLREAWAHGPRTYLGLQVSGFPNLFMVTGPGSPSVLTNMIVSIEHHVEWIADAIAEVEKRGAVTIAASPEAEHAWVELVNAIADFTLFPSCNSWYLGANVPGKPRQFMPYIGFPMYADQVAEITADGYRGFTFA
jgi:cyclohexanone monooxygenase